MSVFTDKICIPGFCMATTAQRLVEAETAYHALQTGQAAVEVRDSDGSLVRYSAANTSRLRQYIADLKAEIAGTTATARRAPMRPVFG